ncbi:Ankyrin repeat, SAM and basic leucine zipper domain-containing protein 1 [Sciurus carolinensis]|uniref:Ankyrin repeat, SAM and basic leucine zipper domain-containing protein 1 n=1 Tax=Sciurus carolinensis TaxID=30640 RepID=A0AA41T452_SCICA|nr:Ankyrin repeat, SAM and basic leucine zipper domain-containing protein 1 [Sciurus carolinensis]
MKKDKFAKFGITKNDQQKILAAVKELEVEEMHFGELPEVAKLEVSADEYLNFLLKLNKQCGHLITAAQNIITKLPVNPHKKQLRVQEPAASSGLQVASGTRTGQSGTSPRSTVPSGVMHLSRLASQSRPPSESLSTQSQPQVLEPTAISDLPAASGTRAGRAARDFSRSDNFSQDARNLFLVRSNIAAQTFAQGYDPYVCRIHGQVQGLFIPSKLHWLRAGFGHHSCSFCQHMTSKSHTRGSATGFETDRDDPYIFMTHTKTPLSAFQIPKTSIMDKNQSTVVAAASVYKAMATPYKPQTK